MTENIPTPAVVVAELRGELAHPERDADLTGLLSSALALVEQQAAILAEVQAIEEADRVDHSTHFGTSCTGETSWKSAIGRDLGGVLSKLPADALAARDAGVLREAAEGRSPDGWYTHTDHGRHQLNLRADRIDREAREA